MKLAFDKAVVVVSHPDDEIMCAGTIRKLVSQGTEVHLVLSCFPIADGTDKIIRSKEFQNSAEALEVYSVAVLNQDEDKLVWNRYYIQAVDEIIQEERPDLVISHRAIDTQQHHSHLGHIVRSACRKNDLTLLEMDQAYPGGVESDAKQPNFFVDITPFIEDKKRVLNCYESQVNKYPGWEDAIIARDHANGWNTNMQGLYDTKYAEAFTLVKSTWR